MIPINQLYNMTDEEVIYHVRMGLVAGFPKELDRVFHILGAAIKSLQTEVACCEEEISRLEKVIDELEAKLNS